MPEPRLEDWRKLPEGVDILTPEWSLGATGCGMCEPGYILHRTQFIGGERIETDYILPPFIKQIIEMNRKFAKEELQRDIKKLLGIKE